MPKLRMNKMTYKTSNRTMEHKWKKMVCLLININELAILSRGVSVGTQNESFILGVIKMLFWGGIFVFQS